MEQWKILVLGVLRLGLKRITTASSPWPTGTDVAELDAWASAPDKCPPGNGDWTGRMAELEATQARWVLVIWVIGLFSGSQTPVWEPGLESYCFQ